MKTSKLIIAPAMALTISACSNVKTPENVVTHIDSTSNLSTQERTATLSFMSTGGRGEPDLLNVTEMVEGTGNGVTRYMTTVTFNETTHRTVGRRDPSVFDDIINKGIISMNTNSPLIIDPTAQTISIDFGPIEIPANH